MSYQVTNCPSTFSAPGVLRRCILPFGHTGDHADDRGPWGLPMPVTPTPGPLSTLERWTVNGQPRCTSVSPVTDRHQCKYASDERHDRHVSTDDAHDWCDNPKRPVNGHKIGGASTPPPVVDAVTRILAVDQNRTVVTIQARLAALTERVETLEAVEKLAKPPSFVPYHPVPPASGWCPVCQRPPLWVVLALAACLVAASVNLGIALGTR